MARHLSGSFPSGSVTSKRSKGKTLVFYLIVHRVRRFRVWRPLYYSGIAIVADQRQSSLVCAERHEFVGRRLLRVRRPDTRTAHARRDHLPGLADADAGEYPNVLRKTKQMKKRSGFQSKIDTLHGHVSVSRVRGVQDRCSFGVTIFSGGIH